MSVNPVVWFEIYVSDMERAKRFYEAVFQKPLARLDAPDPEIEMWTFPMEQNGPGAAGALCKMKGFGPSAGGTLIYFQCEDCAVEEARVVNAGGRVEKPKQSIGQYGAISIVWDSEGNLIGLHSMK